jgi:uncharacterized protein YdgA (DUF945 family)
MLASGLPGALLKGIDVKKGVVGVLVLLAVVVLVSPAIVGRLAEKSMDESLNWAAQESGEVRVTSENFTRGWFSSEGTHRVELRDGDLKSAIMALAGPVDSADELPVLIIHTKLDHGLIPVSSMSRNQGSLAPGLGSAVSTLQIELESGETVDIPGTIYSKVGLTGELLSNYVLEPGSHTEDGMTAFWGATNIEVTTDPRNGKATFHGTVSSVSVDDGSEKVSLGSLTFAGAQALTEYGIAVGDVSFELDDLGVSVGGNDAGGLRSMSVMATTELDGTDVNADATINMVMQGLPEFGEMSFDMAFELAGADAELLGRVQRALEGPGSTQDPMAAYAAAEDDLLALFASGFEMNFEQFNMTVPQGTITSKMLFSFKERDPAGFAWTSLLMTTEATIDLSIPEPLVEMLLQLQPGAAMAIGGGYLVKSGDAYVLAAEMKKGLLTVNGAPIPIPFGAVR